MVTGKLTSKEDGSALPGVNVVLKGTTNGTASDSEGNFKISVPSSGGILVFSFIGLESQEVEIGARNVVDVQLGSDIKQLTEVVVTAQGIQTEKKALGYAVTSVAGTALVERPESDVARLLSGKVPGVSITQTSGISGSGTNFVIRGYTSVSGTNQPLFVVDGVPFNSSTNSQGDFTSGTVTTSSRFLDLDPNNIESINVLKGLSAAVIYGEQGKKGVVLITTKNGVKRKKDLEVNLTQSVFFTKVILPEFQNNFGNGYQNKFGFFFSNWGPHFKDGSAAGYYSPDSIPHPYSHWADASLGAAFPQYQGKHIAYRAQPTIANFFRTGVINTTALNLGASSEKLSYNANFAYSKEQGFTPNNDLIKLNGGIGVTAQLSKRFSNSTTLNVATTEFQSPPVAAAGAGGGTFGAGYSLFSELMFTPRSVDLMGLPYENPVTHGSVYYRTGNDIQNPRWTAAYSRNTDNVRRIFGRTQFTFDITDDINVMYRVGLDTYSELQEYQVNKGGVQNSSFVQGLYRTVNITNRIWNHDILLNYRKAINDKFSVQGVLGGNIRQDDYNQNGIESYQQIVFGFMNHNNFSQHSTTMSFPNSTGVSGLPLQYQSTKIWEGIYMQAILEYSKYLFVTLNARNDWISTLEANNHSLFYKGGSASFLPLMAFNLENDKLNSLKVRISYGESAGFPVPYQTRTTLSSNGRGFVDNNGNPVSTNATAPLLGNKKLKPELQQEIEAGLEGSILKNRISFDISYFNRVTNNLITNVPLDPSTGYQSTTINVGKLTNTGWEVGLNGKPLVTRDFTWDLGLNFYHYNPMVNSLGGGLSQVLISGSTNPGNYAIPGRPFNTILGIGILRDAQGRKVVDNTGIYLNGTSQASLGNPNPNYTLTINNSFSYKGLTLTAQVDYRDGGAIYSTTANTLLGRGVTKDTDVGNRNGTLVVPGVLQDGSPNTTPISYSDAFYSNLLNYGISELSMYDGTTIRLRNVSLSYSLPKALIGKTFKAVSITTTGFNLWYKAVNFPKYSHFDTDMLSTGVGNGLGLDFLTGPSSRRYGASIKITF
ncbi:MAG: SusC/RagA family TonB-linked outer membrane protein [Bacteroidetes bacterium]|nr:SusC/RagA family TonB-linked outer membrane protein [Bacteroidota bacterium]